MTWYPKKIDISLGESLTEAELEFIDNITAGTAAASKAVVLDASADSTGTHNFSATNLKAGKDAQAGTVSVFPATTARGKIIVQCADNTTDHNLTITNAALNGASKTATFPNVAGYVAESTAALTLAEVDRLDDAVTGTPVASKAVIADSNQNIGIVRATALRVGATGAEVAIASTPAQIDAAVAGTPLVYRTNVTTLQVNAGATAVVPAVAGKRFHVCSIMMKSNGNVGTATTVGVKEDGGAIFLSHVLADLTDQVWHDLITGTPVITGMTAGGTTAVANKALLAYCAGGVLDTATSIDYIVCGYYTT